MYFIHAWRYVKLQRLESFERVSYTLWATAWRCSIKSFLVLTRLFICFDNREKQKRNKKQKNNHTTMYLHNKFQNNMNHLAHNHHTIVLNGNISLILSFHLVHFFENFSEGLVRAHQIYIHFWLIVEGCEIWILSHFENRRDFYLLLVGPKNIFKMALPNAWIWMIISIFNYQSKVFWPYWLVINFPI